MPAETVACPIPLDEGWHIGEDKNLEFTVVDAAGAAVDITGWALSWMLKRRIHEADTAAILHKTTGGDVAIISGPDGRCDVVISDEETEVTSIKPGKDYWHELKRTDLGFEAILAQGVVNFNPSVHKA